MKRNVIALALCTVLAISVVGCSSNNDGSKSLASGKLEMKMGYNLDRKTILEGQKFEFENLSLAAFSQAFTGNYERDYTELDKQIYDIIKNGTGDEIQTIENNLDGLKETITITDDFLFYKLESRVYNFK